MDAVNIIIIMMFTNFIIALSLDDDDNEPKLSMFISLLLYINRNPVERKNILMKLWRTNNLCWHLHIFFFPFFFLQNFVNMYTIKTGINTILEYNFCSDSIEFSSSASVKRLTTGNTI